MRRIISALLVSISTTLAVAQGTPPLQLADGAPELLEKSGECEGEEGCLSVPGIYDTVKRASHVRVRALGLDGRPFELEADDLLAVCIQHEMDHLDGKVFVEYLSRLKQTRIKSKLLKQARETF